MGSQGLHVPVQGLGCMGMTPFAGTGLYGSPDEAESLATSHRARELGVNFLNTADVYGPLFNERLVAKATAGQRAQYTIATKFGFEVDDREQMTGGFNGRSAYVRQAIERSLRNLGTDRVRKPRRQLAQNYPCQGREHSFNS